MSVYLTFFNYTPEGAAAISSRRTDEAKKIIKKEKGKFISAYGVMGPYDAMIIAEYPNEKAATKAIIELCRLLGAKSHTMTAIPIEEFDAIASG